MDMWGMAPISGFVRGDNLAHVVQDFNAGAPEGDFMAGGDELPMGFDGNLFQSMHQELEGSYQIPVEGKDFVYSRPGVDYMMSPSPCGAQYQNVSSVGPGPEELVEPVPLHSIWGGPPRLSHPSMLSRQILPLSVPMVAEDQHVLSANQVAEHLLMDPTVVIDSTTDLGEIPLRGKPIDLAHHHMQPKSPDAPDADHVVAGNPIGITPAPPTVSSPHHASDSTASGNTVVTSRVVESPTAQNGPIRPRRQSCQRNTNCVREGNSAVRRRSSKYRGVTKHRRSGRWEAHIWIKDIGRQVYLGGYEIEEHAAEAYDVAALKCKGRRVKTNFDIGRYTDLLKCMDSISLEELIMAVRRQSQGFSRGTSSYRGVTHHPSGRWESRIGIPGSKHIYLGLYDDEKEAARQYDRALVRLRGTSAATNFALSDYREELAEYHQMQQVVLLGDASAEAAMRSGPNFEHWIKFGSKGSSLLEGGTASPSVHTTIKAEIETGDTPTSQHPSN